MVSHREMQEVAVAYHSVNRLRQAEGRALILARLERLQHVNPKSRSGRMSALLSESCQASHAVLRHSGASQGIRLWGVLVESHKGA